MLTVNYQRLDVRRGNEVLDLGAGFGRHAFATLRHGAHVVALDAGRDEMLSTRSMFHAMAMEGEFDPATTRAVALQGDALALPFADEVFDRVICSEILEHLVADTVAMSELWRVLRPGGTMAVTVPRTGPERINWWLSEEYHNVPGGHIRIYTRSVLESRLRRAGFRVRGHHYSHALHSPYWWLKCLVGTSNNDHPLVRRYHQFLVWDMMRKPRFTRWLDTLLNPLLGKSLVVYVEKPR